MSEESQEAKSPAPFVWPALVLATVLFWAIPLFQPRATIHWDLADVTYPAQKYFADSVHAGRLPYWTPFLYSGTPFLSDPQSGAWYPLHWPFYLLGITPRVLFWELALWVGMTTFCRNRSTLREAASNLAR